MALVQRRLAYMHAHFHHTEGAGAHVQLLLRRRRPCGVRRRRAPCGGVGAVLAGVGDVLRELAQQVRELRVYRGGDLCALVQLATDAPPATLDIATLVAQASNATKAAASRQPGSLVHAERGGAALARHQQQISRAGHQDRHDTLQRRTPLSLASRCRQPSHNTGRRDVRATCTVCWIWYHSRAECSGPVRWRTWPLAPVYAPAALRASSSARMAVHRRAAGAPCNGPVSSPPSSPALSSVESNSTAACSRRKACLRGHPAASQNSASVSSTAAREGTSATCTPATPCDNNDEDEMTGTAIARCRSQPAAILC
eukprot:scaffold6918_cov380-Prasinococcus_capsulatus_cf.AAC.3